MLSDSHKKFTLFFLTAVILIDFMGVATVVVLFPKLLLTATGIFPVGWTHGFRLIMMGLFLAIYPLGQFVGASVLGKLSDFHGRKKMLLITLFGTFLGFLFCAIAVELNSALLLFFSRLLAGICAGNVAIAQASLMDISTPQTKTRNITFSQMAMGSAYIIGPILGAWLSQSSLFSWFNMSTPFWFFTAILAILFVLTPIFYKETLIERKKEKINLLGSTQQIYRALTSGHLRMAFVVWLIFVSGWWLFESFMPAFLLQNFHYDTVQIGNLLAFNGALYAAFQYLVVQRVAHKIKPQNMVIYSTVIAGIAIVAIAFATSTLQLYAAMVSFVLAMGFSIPGLIAYISNLADKTDQGQVMGMVNSIQAIATVFVMLAGGYLNSINDAISVVGGGALVIISWLIFVIALSNHKKEVKLLDA